MPGFNKTDMGLTTVAFQQPMQTARVRSNALTTDDATLAVAQPLNNQTALASPNASPAVVNAFRMRDPLPDNVVRPRPTDDETPWRPQRFNRPDILWPLIRINFLNTRDQLKVPISVDGSIHADTLYEDPADPAKKYALPLFTLADHTVAGVTRMRVAFERVMPIDPANQKWQMTVCFNAAKRDPNANDLSFVPAVLLRFTPPIVGASPKEMPFSVEIEASGAFKATLQMTGLTERDQVVNAIKSLDYQTRFIVRCAFSAAVPNSVDANGVQWYRQEGRSVDVPLDRDPLVFDPAIAPYIFANVQDASNQVLGNKLHQLEFKGRIHHYYQDEARPYLFYYLPDSFKVIRSPSPPYLPQIRVRFRSDDGSLEKMRASLEYVATPVVNGERLQDAHAAFKNLLPAPMPPDVDGAVFQPLVVDDVDQITLNLTLPRQSEGGLIGMARSGVVKKLSEPFSDGVDELSLQNFQDVFDALFGKSSVIFSGDVHVAKTGNRPAETVPFIARLDDLYGPLLEAFESPQPDGRVSVRLKNRIESPLTLRSVPVSILHDGRLISAHIENLNKAGGPTSFPVDLSPDEELQLDVMADQPLAAEGGPPDALFMLDDISVKPDSTAVWNSILDASVPAEYTRKISVMGVAEWFAPLTDVLAVAIDFANGDHVVLKNNQLEASASVRMPISDLILRKVQDSQYRYTQIVIRTDGQTRSEKTDSLDILFPELTP